MSILKPGETCWRIAHASRAAFIVDTEAYYTAIYEALQKAQHSVLLLGWGFDPRVRLFPDGDETPNDPDEVGRVLIELSEARPDLEIRLLIWKSALPIAASQQFFPHKARAWFRGSRVKFVLDDQVPFGGCHHQKALIIDDKVAFCASGDVCVDRWDTAAHLDDDQRRIMPTHECHDPRHEVVMMVEGEAAKALGDLARERWRIATGEAIAECEAPQADAWPDHIPAQLRDVQVSIQRTAPDWGGRKPVYEIRRLTLESIRAAKHVIYLENQYFTAPMIGEAIAARLAEPDGPEVILISTGHAPSWFDHATMDRARSNLLWRLKSADIFHRFRAWHPVTRGGKTIIVHSKVTVIDDTLVRVGSANLNNRSAGFDTELEIGVEAADGDERHAVSAFRDRLIGHFLGRTGDAVAKAHAEHGGLIRAIETLNTEGRLSPIKPMEQSALGELIATYHIGDPANVSDSWRPSRRRDRLYAEARAQALPRS